MPHQKKSPKKSVLFSPALTALVVSISCSWFTWGFTDNFWSLFINEVTGNNYFITGTFSALYHFLTIISVLFWGRLVDDVDPLRLVFWNRFFYLFVGPLYFFAGYFHSPLILLLGFLINTVAKGMRDVGEQTFLMEHSNAKNCSRILGISFAIKNTAWILGMFCAAGILYILGSQVAEFTIVYHMYLLLFPGVGIGVFLLWKQNSNFAPIAPQIKHKIKKLVLEDKVILPVLRDLKHFSLPLKASLYLFAFLETLSQSIAFFIPLLAMELGLKFFEICILIAVIYLPLFFLFVFSYLADHCDRLMIIRRGVGLSTLPLLCIGFTQNPILIGTLSAAIALAYAVIQPALAGFNTALSPEDKKGEIASLQFFFTRVGTILSTFCLGFVAEYFGMHSMFLVLAGITLLVFGVVIWLGHYIQKNQQFHRLLLHSKHKMHHHHHIFAHVHFHNSQKH